MEMFAIFNNGNRFSGFTVWENGVCVKLHTAFYSLIDLFLHYEDERCAYVLFLREA